MLLLCLAILVTGATGCVHWFDGEATKAKSSPLAAAAAKGKKRTGVEGYTIGEGEQPPPSPDSFIKVFEERAAFNSETLLTSIVLRYPDAACEYLRRGNTSASTQRDRTAPVTASQSLSAKRLASLVDRHLVKQAGNQGWDSAVQPTAKILDWQTKRQSALEFIQTGAHDKIPFSELNRLGDALPLPLRIENQRLLAVAYMGCGKHDEAIAAVERALPWTTQFPMESAHLRVMLSELYHQVEKHDQAVAVWKQAVEQASDFVALPEPVLDPRFWERAIVAQPYGIKFPEGTTKILQAAVEKHYLRGMKLPPSAAAGQFQENVEAIWMWIGHARLERKEGKAALIAFKRAESICTSADVNDRLRLSQAQSLMLIGQPGVAIPFLVGLTTKNATEVSVSALAALGTMKIAEGATDQGMMILRKAVDLSEGKDWPSRAEAEADLGLAFLMLGRERDGMECLHRAQEQFGRTGQTEHLARSLLNEAAYLEKMGEALKSQEARARIAGIR